MESLVLCIDWEPATKLWGWTIYDGPDAVHAGRESSVNKALVVGGYRLNEILESQAIAEKLIKDLYEDQ